MATRTPTAAGRLQYQPISSLITLQPGERVLLRLSNLGYQNHAMTVDNIDLQIIAKDASLLKGRDGTTNYLTTNTVDVGPGESRDVIFTAPAPARTCSTTASTPISTTAAVPATAA